MSRIHEVKNGKATRMSFSSIKEVVDMPDLIDIQKNSYDWFLKSGLKDVLADASPISDFSGNLLLEFGEITQDKIVRETKIILDKYTDITTLLSESLKKFNSSI